jgi:transcriptional regulator with XRE-family HTH domain
VKEQEIFKKFGNNLSNVLYENKISQRELSVKLGVTDQAVSNWVRGIKIPRYETLYNVMEILDCTPNDLIPFPELKNSNAGTTNSQTTKNDVYKLATILDYIMKNNMDAKQIERMLIYYESITKVNPAIKDAVDKLLDMD